VIDIALCAYAQLVFTPKYRRHVFQDRHLEALKLIFAKVCIDFKAELVEMDGEDDHVHLLVNYPPHVELSKLINSLKGVSSKPFGKYVEILILVPTT
jgi:putative transposase